MSVVLLQDINEDSHLTEEQRKYRRQIYAAEKAIERRKLNHERRLQADRETDDDERLAVVSILNTKRRVRTSTGYSVFDSKNRTFEFCGDYPKARFWQDAPRYVIDSTTQDSEDCWLYIEDFDKDEDWYTRGPEEFHRHEILLTPGATEREYGRVFFSKEIHYLDPLDVNPTS